MSELERLRAENEKLREKAEHFRKLESEASTHVETVICMRTHFTGEPPYVGWQGLGLALREALDERDRLREEVGRSNWQPIETAPKDGSLVLLWVPDLEQTVVGFYGWPAWNYWTGECVWLEVTGDEWGLLEDSLQGNRGPTHWMPLPPPPSTPDPATLNIGGGR